MSVFSLDGFGLRGANSKAGLSVLLLMSWLTAIGAKHMTRMPLIGFRSERVFDPEMGKYKTVLVANDPKAQQAFQRLLQAGMESRQAEKSHED